MEEKGNAFMEDPRKSKLAHEALQGAWGGRERNTKGKARMDLREHKYLCIVPWGERAVDQRRIGTSSPICLISRVLGLMHVPT